MSSSNVPFTVNVSPAVSAIGLSVIVKLVSANTANCVVALLPNNPVVPAIPLNVTLRSAGPTDRLLGTFKVPSAVPFAAVVNTALILVPTISTVIACCERFHQYCLLTKFAMKHYRHGLFYRLEMLVQDHLLMAL